MRYSQRHNFPIFDDVDVADLNDYSDKLAEALEGATGDQDERIDEQLRNMTLEDPSSAEIVDARGGYNLLRYRLEADETNIATNATTIGKKVYFHNNVNNMKADTSLKVGDVVQTLGYYNSNDGGAALHRIVAASTSVSTFAHILDNGLKALLIADDSINIRQIGAKGSQTALSTIFDTLEKAQAVYSVATDLTEFIDEVALKTAINNFGKKVFVPRGTYYLNKPMQIDVPYKYICGDERQYSSLKYTVEETTDTNAIEFTSNANHIIIENLQIQGPHNYSATPEERADFTTSCLAFINSSDNTIRNCRIIAGKYGVYTNHCWVNKLEDCQIRNNYMGVLFNGDEINDCYIERCTIQNNNTGVYFTGGRTQICYGCDIEDNNEWGIYKTNYGDLQVNNCYFEDKIKIAYGTTAVQSVCIFGSSFWSSNAVRRLPFIEYNGAVDYTKILIAGNLFNNDATATADDYVVAQKSGNTDVNPFTISPIFVANHCNNCIITRLARYSGSIVEEGTIYNYAKKTISSSYLNIHNTATTNLLLKENGRKYRVAGSSGNTGVIRPPELTSKPAENVEYEFIVPGNVASGSTDILKFEAQDSSNTQIYGDTLSFTLNDLRNKSVKLVFMDKISDKFTWQVLV